MIQPNFQSEQDNNCGRATKSDAIKTTLDRPVFHQNSFNEAYQLSRPPHKNGFVDGYHKASSYARKRCTCDSNTLWNFTKRRIPVLDWVPKYDIKNNALPDLLGGLTVGIMQIPQGMSYALMAEVPSVVGLYVSFFSVLVYFLFGTSRHLSMGTFGIVCLMVGQAVDNYVDDHPLPDPDSYVTASLDDNYSSSTVPPDNDDDLQDLKILVATMIAFTVGVLQLGMAILQLGSLTVYLSETLVSGFTTGAAVQIFTSQVKYVLGLSIPSHNGVLGLIYTYIDVFDNIKETNLVALGLGGSVIVSLVLVNECINRRFKGRMIMPVPMELLVIIAGTLTSYYLDLHDNYDVVIVGDIPTGMPPPKVPQFNMMGDVIVSSVAIAIVSFCLPFSMAKTFAKKHRYEVEPNQEMMAYGLGNFVGGFFMCFPSCGSLSRSSVQEGSGAKTQMASLAASVLVLIVILFIAPLFEPLPNCVLGGIVMVALRGMFMQCTDLFKLWKVSYTETAVWLWTFISVVLLDVNYGLVSAVAFILVVFLYKLQRPHSTLLGNIPSTDTYLDINKYQMSKEVKGVKIVSFGGPLYFANREYFRSTMYKLVFNPQAEIVRRNKEDKKLRKHAKTVSKKKLIVENGKHQDIVSCPEKWVGDIDGLSADEVFEERLDHDPNMVTISSDTVSAVILECAAVGFIDSSAISVLAQLVREFNEVGVRLCLSCCKDNVLIKLEKSDLYSDIENNIFPTTHDAILHIIHVKTTPLSPAISSVIAESTIISSLDE